MVMSKPHGGRPRGGGRKRRMHAKHNQKDQGDMHELCIGYNSSDLLVQCARYCPDDISDILIVITYSAEHQTARRK